MGVGMVRAIPPVRKRQVIVDPDEVDVRVGPQLIKVEIEVPRPVIIAGIFRPVRRIGDLVCGWQNAPYIRRQLAQCCNRRKAVTRPADLCQPTQL